MFKTTLISIFLICSACIVFGAPGLRRDPRSNEPRTKRALFKAGDGITSAELITAFPDPKDLRVKNLSANHKAIFNQIAREQGVSLEEYLIFTRTALQKLKNRSEGKNSDESIDQDALCTEIEPLPNTRLNGNLSTVAKAIQELRQICASREISARRSK